jgi:hypothetical protein
MTESNGEINKTIFLDLLVEFMKREGVVIERDFNFLKSNKDYYSLFRNFIVFEMAVAMAGGKLAIPGIGKKEVILNKHGKPFLRSKFSDRHQDFMRANFDRVDMNGSYIKIVDGVRVVDVEGLSKRVFELYDEFKDSRKVKKSSGVDDTAANSEFLNKK